MKFNSLSLLLAFNLKFILSVGKIMIAACLLAPYDLSAFVDPFTQKWCLCLSEDMFLVEN